MSRTTPEVQKSPSTGQPAAAPLESTSARYLDVRPKGAGESARTRGLTMCVRARSLRTGFANENRRKSENRRRLPRFAIPANWLRIATGNNGYHDLARLCTSSTKTPLSTGVPTRYRSHEREKRRRIVISQKVYDVYVANYSERHGYY